MKTTDRWSLLAFLVLAAVALGACDRASESGDDRETVATGDAEPESADPAEDPVTDPSCPPEADVAAAVGFPVQSKPWGMGCFYETADFETSVAIMRISPSQADQVEREMREAAGPYGAEVVEIEVGDRGHAWGSPAQSQGYAVSGDRAWMLDVVTTSGSGDKRPAVIQILEMMTG